MTDAVNECICGSWQLDGFYLSRCPVHGDGEGSDADRFGVDQPRTLVECEHGFDMCPRCDRV